MMSCSYVVGVLVFLLLFLSLSFCHGQPSSDYYSMDHPDGRVNPEDYKKPVSHQHLQEYLKQNNHVQSSAVSHIMSHLQRHNYVSERARATGMSYWDQPLYIGYDATISAPKMHAGCLEQLVNVCPQGGNVLDIGTGSGYMTAALALLVGPSGRVTAIDIMNELIDFARDSITRDRPDLLPQIQFAVANGHAGYPSNAPYDCIHSGAYFDQVPQPLIDQLKIGGSLLIPLSRTGTLVWTLVTKTSASTVDHHPHHTIDNAADGGIERALRPNQSARDL